MRFRTAALFLAVGMLLALPLSGVDTTFWQLGTFDDLLQGTLKGVSLTKDGVVELAPESQSIFSPDEALALSIASDRQGNLYLGTGHQGKVFKVDASGKGSLFFTAQEPDIFALATGPDGALYVGSSPEGKVYRVNADGTGKVFFAPNTKYIWSLLFDSQGRLYIGTGDHGLIYRVDTDGQGKVFYDTKQTHVMCLTRDAAGNLLAGSVPNGLIFRISPEGKAFVLYQADLPEVHDLAVDSEGHIYAAALGGGPGRTVPFMFGPQVPGMQPAGAVTTVTVTAESPESEGTGSKAQQKPPTQNQTQQSPSFNRPAPTAGFTMAQPPQGKGKVIEIQPDGTVETVWSSNKESVFGLALEGKRVLFTTDQDGRIFELTPSEDGADVTLLTETHESLATRLLFKGSTLYVTTSNIARLIRLGSAPGREGTYESPVKDTKFVSRWGVLAWRGDVADGSSLEFFTRSGNSDRPDETWSNWSGPYKDPNGIAIQSPPARYIQWKAVFHATGSESPELDDVTLSYLNQNLPPEIRTFNVSTGGERTGPSGAPSVGAMPAGVSTATISVAPGPTQITGFTVPAPTKPQPMPTVLSWQAEDPNGDTLVFSLYVKAADERDWHLLKDNLKQTSFLIDPDTLPDGKYTARLVASDAPSNPPATARRTELISAPFWIDNTPPRVEVVSQKVEGRRVEVRFRAEDVTSPLRAAEVSTDSKDWHDVVSDDGIVDSRVETFTVRADNLGPGEHVIILRAYDTAGNAGLGKAVVRVSGAERATR